jgi:hypothetical protein
VYSMLDPHAVLREAIMTDFQTEHTGLRLPPVGSPSEPQKASDLAGSDEAVVRLLGHSDHVLNRPLASRFVCAL